MIRRERLSPHPTWLLAFGEDRAGVTGPTDGQGGGLVRSTFRYVGYEVDYSETMNEIAHDWLLTSFGAIGRASTLDASAMQLLAVPNVVVPEGQPVLDWIDQVGLTDDALATVDAIRRYFPDAALCIEPDRGPDAGGLLRVTVLPDGTSPEAEDAALEAFDEEWLLGQHHRLRSRINVHLA